MYIKEIIDFLKTEKKTFLFEGDANIEIIGYSSIFKYKRDTLTWLRDISTLERIDDNSTEQFACLITVTGTRRIENARAQIWVENPKDIFFEVVGTFYGEKVFVSISDAAIVERGAIVGEGVSIGPFTHISNQTVIGNNCVIGSNVTIKGKVTIGDHCVIQSGAVIGEDGFAFIKENNVQKFIKHYGGVTLKDYVQIGAQTCICRGAIDDTIIDEYTKIDNLCHIAHNVEIGKRCLVIAGTIIMGSVHIGDDCWISTSIIRDLRHIEENSVVGMGAVVVKDISMGKTVIGNPAKELK